LMLAITFTFSCSGDIDGGNGVSSSSKETAQTYAYCVYSADKFCTEGPYTECKGDGIPSNNCPYGSSSAVESSSSSSSLPSSSSNTISSSSSIIPSSSSAPTQSVDYEGETYQTIVIGTQTWMARNLNYAVADSKCYDNDPVNCEIYGRLYYWATAMALPSSCNSSLCTSQVSAKHRGICPSGWHIPSNDDWDKLLLYVDNENSGNGSNGNPYKSYTAGMYLKSTDGWYDGGNGNDKYGFSAIPGGYAGWDGGFYDVGFSGNWWNASESNSGNAYLEFMQCSIKDVRIGSGYRKDLLFSVRCVKD